MAVQAMPFAPAPSVPKAFAAERPFAPSTRRSFCARTGDRGRSQGGGIHRDDAPRPRLSQLRRRLLRRGGPGFGAPALPGPDHRGRSARRRQRHRRRPRNLLGAADPGPLRHRRPARRDQGVDPRRGHRLQAVSGGGHRPRSRPRAGVALVHPPLRVPGAARVPPGPRSRFVLRRPRSPRSARNRPPTSR